MEEAVDLVKTGKNNLLEEKLKKEPLLASTKTEQGISLLQLAAYCRNMEAVKLIRDNLSEIDIFEAASLGERDVLLNWIEKDPNQINAHASDGFTPLGLASFFGHADIVKMLLANGSDPNIAANNQFKVAPLHSACAISNYEIAEILIKNGADVNARQMQGVTPLHSAAHNGQTRIAKLLIDNGAQVNLKMDNGQTPLFMAQEKECKELVDLLKKKGGRAV